MQDYNIKIRRYNGVDYDTLYPATKTSLLQGTIAKNQLATGATYTALTVTLDKDNWNSTTLQQTVTAQGVTTTNAVIIAPSVTSMSAYSECGIYCSSQAANSLTFTCETIPDDDVDVNVLILT